MRDEPAISVVMPMRNAQKWLPITLSALARERDTDFELIAIDDGSDDNSAETIKYLCRHWPKRNFRLLKTENRGVSAARNLGINASNAAIIAFLDADDKVLPGRLGESINFLQENPYLSHAHSGWWRCNSHGILEKKIQPWCKGADFTWRRFMEHKAVLPSAWSVKRNAILEVGGFNENLKHAEDVDLLLRLAKCGHKGGWIKKELVSYRVHTENTSKQIGPNLLGTLEVVENHLSQLSTKEAIWAQGIRFHTGVWAAWKAWANDNPKLSLYLLETSFKHCTYSLARRPVCLIEEFSKHCKSNGMIFKTELFIKSKFWRDAEKIILAR